MSTLGWVIALLLGLALLSAAFIIGRIYVLSHQRGSFRTFMRVTSGPGMDEGWMRGYACYGQKNMAWSGLVRLRIQPDFLLPRTSLGLSGTPLHDPETGTSTLFLSDNDRSYEMVLSTGDYEGLVSWVDSAPPEAH